jgi:hypothetical protein
VQVTADEAIAMVAQQVAQHQQRQQQQQQQQQPTQNIEMADESDVVVGQPSPAAIRAAVQQQQQQDSSSVAGLTGQPTGTGDSAVSVVINQNNSLVLNDPKMMTEKLVSELQVS